MSHTRRKINAYIVQIGNPEGRRPLGRLRPTRENNIKTTNFNMFHTCALNCNI